MSEKTKDRVYVVEIQGQRARLVRATFGHIAERHVIGQLVKARVATKDDLIELMTRGVRCEDAAAAGNGQLPEPELQFEQRSGEFQPFANTGA